MGPTSDTAPAPDDGFTLVEILVAIVLVGILSAVVVVGVRSITDEGAAASCAASRDAAQVGATAYWTEHLTQPATFGDMVTAGTLELSDGVTVDAGGLVATGEGWTLHLESGPAGVTFTCSTGEPPAGFVTGPNGHWYLFVPGTMSWDDASTAAATYTHAGLTGHLATITSQAEQDFVFGLTGGTNSVWLGATDTVAEGVWRWTVGPEAGTQFSTDAVPFAGAFTAWHGGQPDNWDEEDCLHIYEYFGNGWNDVPCDWPHNHGFVVELGG